MSKSLKHLVKNLVGEAMDDGDESEVAEVQAYFDELEDQAVRWIKRHEVVFGCMAYLTSQRVVQALHECRLSCVVIGSTTWMNSNISALLSDPNTLPYDEIFDFDDPETPGYTSERRFDRCRVVECDLPRYANEKQKPIMHHKFLIGGRLVPSSVTTSPILFPEFNSLWIGSYNATQQANVSLNSVVVINGSEELCRTFVTEFRHLLENSRLYGSRRNELEWATGSVSRW